jgi:ATP-binding cassette subfamily F protein 3
MHLLSMVADRLWLVSNGTVKPYEEDLEAYRKMLLAPTKPVSKNARPKEAPKPKRASRDEVLALRSEVRKAEARVDKLNEMRDKLASKLADPALYEDGKVGELEVWNKKYAEVMDALDRAEGLWMSAEEKLEKATA